METVFNITAGVIVVSFGAIAISAAICTMTLAIESFRDCMRR